MLNEGSGTTASISKTDFSPRPSHSGHAPKGLLNEKLRGSISSMLMLHSGQANFSENRRVSPFISISARPSESFSAVSTESASLRFSPSLSLSLSMETLIECFIFLSSSISSSRRLCSPSTITRTKPSFRSFSKTFLYSPFFPLTMGE